MTKVDVNHVQDGDDFLEQDFAEDKNSSTRRCIVSRSILDKADMIRFVLSPEGVVTPDILCKLPGRGLWVTNSKEILEITLKKNLFSKAFKRQVKISENFIDELKMLLWDRAVQQLSLTRRAGFAVCGFEKVKGLLKTKSLRVIISCADSSSNNYEELRRLALLNNAKYIDWIDSKLVSGIFSREEITFAGIIHSPLANNFVASAERANIFTRNIND